MVYNIAQSYQTAESAIHYLLLLDHSPSTKKGFSRKKYTSDPIVIDYVHYFLLDTNSYPLFVTFKLNFLGFVELPAQSTVVQLGFSHQHLLQSYQSLFEQLR